jgi:hypothetical protein
MAIQFLVEEAPCDNQIFRESLYNGDTFLLPCGASSLEMVLSIRETISLFFGSEPRLSHEQLSVEEHWQRVQGARLEVSQRSDLFRPICQSLGFDLPEIGVENSSLRVVISGGHKNSKAAPAYVAHRDTWYGYSQSTINIWIPLWDVEEEETFVFYPEFFDKPVSNTSGCFDSETWKVPGQSEAHCYPEALEVPEHARRGFRAKGGDVLIFSGSHLHQTCRQESGRTRFSIDFRILHLADHRQGKGAPNVDNHSGLQSLERFLFIPG